MERFLRHRDDQKALQLLRTYAGAAQKGPVTLSSEYLLAIARCEALPENQDGCDKTWVERSRRRFRRHYARARRVR
jgi:hypothetical protein